MSEILRYGVAGLINTITGYGVFWVSLRWAGLRPEAANAIGYAVALCVAFLLNRYLVFSGATSSVATVLRFVVSFVAAFLLNQVVLYILFRFFLVAPEIAQVFAMIVYTVAFYLLNKYFIFAVRRHSVSN